MNNRSWLFKLNVIFVCVLNQISVGFSQDNPADSININSEQTYYDTTRNEKFTSIIPYKNGLKEGIAYVFLSKKMSLFKLCYYKADTLRYAAQFHYGTITFDCQTIGEVCHGVSRTYKRKRLFVTRNYLNGKLNGEETFYYRRKTVTYIYKDDVMLGRKKSK